jgi:hypothetical protein
LFFHQDLIEVADRLIQLFTESFGTLRLSLAGILADASGSTSSGLTAVSASASGFATLTCGTIALSVAVCGAAHATDAAGKLNTTATIAVACAIADLTRAVATTTAAH